MTDQATELTLTKAQTEFMEEIDKVYNIATAEDKAQASDLGKSGKPPSIEEISPTLAAVLYVEHNGQNRNFTVSKAHGYRQAMLDGEWRLNHQGIAFYPDGKIADGQHRIAATALSGSAQQYVVYRDFDKKAIDTIDRATRRTAGEALEMMGVHNGREKATVSKAVMGYIFEEEHQARPKYTDQKIETWAIAHEEILTAALVIGKQSIHNVTDPSLNWREAATVAALMRLGGWPDQQIVGFLSSMQTGVATYPESPTVALSKLFMRAKLRARKNDALTQREKLALSLKAAHLWIENASVARLTIDLRKETLPPHVRTAPVVAAA
jgi:hypothetical protein